MFLTQKLSQSPFQNLETEVYHSLTPLIFGHAIKQFHHITPGKFKICVEKMTIARDFNSRIRSLTS
jgi:hypothetical protein